MFDGLKDTIDKFRSDAEEAAEEAPEEEAAEADPSTEDTDDDVSFTKKAKSLATGKVIIREKDLEDALWDLEQALLAADVEMEVAEELLRQLRDELAGEAHSVTKSIDEVVTDTLAAALIDVMTVDEAAFDTALETTDGPVVLVFTGVNGVGKTTTIAKLSRYLESQGYSSVLANGDTFRAGANEQIEEHASRLDRPVISHEQGGDPAAVIYDAVEYAEANDVDVVLGDTAGRLHTSEGLMDQLAKIDRVVDPDLTIFVDEAVAGQDAVDRAREFNDAAAIDGVILTKADADAHGGAAISIAHTIDRPIFFLGTGQGYEDLTAFDPQWLVDRLLEDEAAPAQ